LVGNETHSVLQMMFPETLRDEHFEFLPQQLLPLITKHLFEPRVG
jgi:hypothetical protein